MTNTRFVTFLSHFLSHFFCDIDGVDFKKMFFVVSYFFKYEEFFVKKCNTKNISLQNFRPHGRSISSLAAEGLLVGQINLLLTPKSNQYFLAHPSRAASHAIKTECLYYLDYKMTQMYYRYIMF